MAVADTTSTGEVVDLKANQSSESPLRQSLRRLVRNKAAMVGIIIIILNILVAIFAPTLAPKSFREIEIRDKNVAPQWVIDLFPNMRSRDADPERGYVVVNDEYSLGADALGRDLLSRIIYGARVSLAVAFIGPFVSLIVGLAVGLIAGYFGGRVDNLLMRIVDIVYAFPVLLFVVLMMAYFRASFNAEVEEGTFSYFMAELDQQVGGMLFIFIGIGLTSWMQVARLARGQVLSVREQEYIHAAHSIGVPQRRIILRHILPNIMGPIVVAETLTIPTYISYEAFLSFIGLGVNPPTPSWGSMISEGSRAISTYPNQAIFPALALFIIMFAFNFLGDGLRDALDPRANRN
jgi:oligopeptide transport system permease protein